MFIATISYHDKEHDKIKKDTIVANTLGQIYKLVGKYIFDKTILEVLIQRG